MENLVTLSLDSPYTAKCNDITYGLSDPGLHLLGSADPIDFHSVIGEPIDFQVECAMRGIPMHSTNPPPVLHLITGEAKDTIDKLEDIDSNFSQSFLKEIRVIKSPMCGGEGFRGNDARKIFRCGGGLGVLRAMANASDSYGKRGETPVALLRAKSNAFWVETLHLLIDTVEACDVVIEETFGPVLGYQWQEAIDAWQLAWKAFENAYIRAVPRHGRSLVTPKKHCFGAIVPKFVAERGLSLGLFSEQSFETAHGVLAAHEKLYSIPRCGEARKLSKGKVKRKRRRSRTPQPSSAVGNVKEAALRRWRAVVSFNVSNLPDDQASIERQEIAVGIHEGNRDFLDEFGNPPWNLFR